MSDLNPDDKDCFRGEDAVRRFSASLAVGLGDEIPEEDIVATLGPESLAAFRFAQRALHGFVRRTTGEPTFCHSADIALRALDLGYSQRIIQVALLHDTVEDRSKSLADVLEHLAEIQGLMGEDVAQDVRRSTNVYSLIIRPLADLVPRNLPFDESAAPALRHAVQHVRAELPGHVRRAFAHEFDQLIDYFIGEVDFSAGARKARVDRKFTPVSELRLHSYKLFVQDIHSDARFREGLGQGFHEATLVVKTLDLVDNLRTSEVANFAALERILLKAETFLDCTFFLHDFIRALPQVKSSFIDLYDYLKYHLMQQLLERKRALVFLADTRFACLADYLMREVTRLQEKYKVHGQPLQELARLRQTLRQFNHERTRQLESLRA